MVSQIGLVERPWSTERRGISPLFLLGKSKSDEGYKQHARKKLFNALFNFVRKLDFHDVCVKIRKDEFPDVITLTAKISKAIAGILREHQNFGEQFNRIIIYYDNGQIELTKILTSVFNTFMSM